MRSHIEKIVVTAASALFAVVGFGAVDLNGLWEFRFAEGKSIATAGGADFKATDAMSVPGCYDMQPKWLCKRGTGLYRRTFTLREAVPNAWLVVDGMGLTGKFEIDGKDLGPHPYPYARLEIETGPLAAGEHTIFAALDNRFDWKTQKLVHPYYDFYCYGGFYHGVSLVFDNRKLLVRTRDYKTGTVEIEAVNFAKCDFDAKLVFDGKNEVAAKFANARATVRVPDFRLWSPDSPNLHTVSLATEKGAVAARFGIREIKAAKKRLWLNGKVLFLKGANRHEAHPQFGAATPEALMVQDIQLLKSLNGNFFRGSHYQQSQRFLDYCDEMGVLVWEESCGWGNRVNQMSDPEFFRQQVHQTREMVRASFNHPSVIIFAYMNENASETKVGKKLNDALIAAIKAEDSGRLVSFACNRTGNDISNENTDIVSFNTYPGWIGTNAGTFEKQKRMIDEDVTKIVKRFRKLYPEKPIIVSEMGTAAIYGAHDPAAGQGTEEFQYHYNKDVLDRVFSDPELAGLTFWHFADARTFHRDGSSIRTKLLAENLAGLFDGYRRAKIVTEVVREGFARKAAGEEAAEDLASKVALVPAPREQMWTGEVCADPMKKVRYERDASIPSEGYRLEISPDSVVITSSDDAGAFYAMKTLKQLGDKKVPCGRVTDAPAFRWRSLMLDEARHFFGKETVKRLLDQMADHKLNVFHWHLTDDQGWRLAIEQFPELVKYGSVRPESPVRGVIGGAKDYRGDGQQYGPYFYSAADIKEILAYAKERHITVVPEIDMPGHVRALLAAHPEFACRKGLPQVPRTMNDIEQDVLCAGNDDAVRFLEKVLDEVCELFPGEYIHIGGDECPKGRWKACAKCQTRIKALGLKGENGLQAWFTRHFTDYLAKKGRRAIGWEEVLDGGPDAKTVVHVWHYADRAAKAVAKGHDIVVSAIRSTYFSIPQGVKDDPFTYLSPRLRCPLSKAYSFDPLFGVPDAAKPRVMGAECCMWSECVWNEFDLAFKLWPRACAFAEAVWTAPASPRDFGDFKRRMSVHRSRLVSGKVNCAPLD